MTEDDDGWEFAVSDVGDESTEGEPAVGDEADSEAESGGNVAGTLGGEEGLEPGTPTGENVFFVLLGAAGTVLLFLVVLGVL